jgi:hypothetical protein
MHRGLSTGLAVVVRWEGEPVGRHYLLARQQITVGSGRAADLRVSDSTVRRCQPLLQARADGYQLLLPPGGRAVCRATSPAPGVYRTPERRVYEAGAHPGDDQALCFDHETEVSIDVGSWQLSVRPSGSAPDWAEHSPQVVAQGFRQSLTWHRDRQAQLKWGAARAPKGRWWPFVLGSAAVHVAALLLVFAVPPEMTCCFDSFYPFCGGGPYAVVVRRDWTARRASIKAHVDLKHRRPTIRTSIDLDPPGGGIEPPLNRALRARLRAALKRHRGFLRSCIPNWRWRASLLHVRLEADGRGRIAQTALPENLGPATRACMRKALLRWELPATGWPLEVFTVLDLAEPARSAPAASGPT